MKVLVFEDLTEKEEKKIEEQLSKIGIEYEEFETPLEAFYSQEAAWRIKCYCEYRDIKDQEIIDRLIEENQEILAAKFWDSENVLCADELDDLTEECLEE